MATGVLGEEAFSPVREGERAATLDALRGAAILGILAVNLESFRTPGWWGGYRSGYETPIGQWLWRRFSYGGRLEMGESPR